MSYNQTEEELDWGDAPIDSEEYDRKMELQEYYRARSNHSNDEES